MSILKPFLAVVAALLLLPVHVSGQGTPAPDPATEALPDFEVARRAVQQGEILPLVEVLRRLEADQPGEVIEVELEYEGGQLIYEIELITTDGRLIEIEMDARTGTLHPAEPETEDGSADESDDD